MVFEFDKLTQDNRRRFARYRFTAMLLIEEARANEKMFRDFVEAAPDAKVIAGEAGKIVLVNNQTEKLFGYDRKELLGKKVEIPTPQTPAYLKARTYFNSSRPPNPRGRV